MAAADHICRSIWSTASSPDPCPSCSKIGTHRLSCPNDKVAPWGAWKKPATAEKKSEVTEMVHKGFKLFREELGAREPKAKKEAQFADRHSIDRTEYPLKNKPEGLGKPKDKAQLKGAAGERQVLKQGTSDLPDKSGFKNAQTPVTFAHKREGEFKPLSISPSTVKPELKGTK